MLIFPFPFLFIVTLCFFFFPFLQTVLITCLLNLPFSFFFREECLFIFIPPPPLPLPTSTYLTTSSACDLNKKKRGHTLPPNTSTHHLHFHSRSFTHSVLCKARSTLSFLFCSSVWAAGKAVFFTGVVVVGCHLVIYLFIIKVKNGHIYELLVLCWNSAPPEYARFCRPAADGDRWSEFSLLPLLFFFCRSASSRRLSTVAVISALVQE